MDSKSLDLLNEESQIRNTSVKNHREVSDLSAKLLNCFINGFNLIPSLHTDESDVSWAWLFLIVRSFQSLRCSIKLMETGYYAQAMVLIRMVTEDYFLCGNCETDPTVVKALLGKKPIAQKRKKQFNYRELAKSMGSELFYEKAYAFECDFAHASNLSLGVLTAEIDANNRELKPAPQYNRVLLLACCEMAFRNGVLMMPFLEKLLASISTEKADAWRSQCQQSIDEIISWLDGLKQRFVAENTTGTERTTET